MHASNTTMDQPQSLIMPDNSISQNPDDDVLSIIEIIKDGSTVASQASNSSQGLPTVPFHLPQGTTTQISPGIRDGARVIENGQIAHKTSGACIH